MRKPDLETGQCLPAIIVAMLIFIAAQGAAADEVGPACVENGSVLVIDGKRASGKCNGGTPVRLYGVKAPSLRTDCKLSGGEDWRCGLASAAALLQAVRGQRVTCKGNSTDRDGYLIALCFVGARSLNQFMIEMGWASADTSVTSMYTGFEEAARAARRGLWSSDYDPSRADGE